MMQTIIFQGVTIVMRWGTVHGIVLNHVSLTVATVRILGTTLKIAQSCLKSRRHGIVDNIVKRWLILNHRSLVELSQVEHIPT
jgi:hypothetical protein